MLEDWIASGGLKPTLEKVRRLTMVPEPALVDLARQMSVVLTEGVAGDFVECGVWCGGASFLMADLLCRAGISDRKVWLFDSFEGMPPPEEIDGPEALAWARNPHKPWYADSVPLSLEAVRRSAADLGLTACTEFVKGWFDETLPANRGRIGPIAILRIDCDWYSSVKCCLENLYDQVADGGFVVLDDYYTYDGCALAVHEFLSGRRLPHRIETVVGDWENCEIHHGARFRKGETNWVWKHRLRLAALDLADHIAPNDAFILVDEDRLGSDLVEGRRATPFPERDGLYAGPPSDDESAIREVERLRKAGANFMVFAWPAFWWLDHYCGLNRYLGSRFARILENERLVVFDLRP